MSEPIIIDGDRMLANPASLAERLVPRKAPPENRFMLTVQKKKTKGLEAKCPEMGPLLELSWQLEELGYQFVRLERLEAAA